MDLKIVENNWAILMILGYTPFHFHKVDAIERVDTIERRWPLQIIYTHKEQNIEGLYYETISDCLNHI